MYTYREKQKFACAYTRHIHKIIILKIQRIHSSFVSMSLEEREREQVREREGIERVNVKIKNKTKIKKKK